MLLMTMTGCSSFAPQQLVVFDGFTSAPIKGEDIRAQTFGARIEWDTQPLTDLSPTYGEINLGLEFFGSVTFRPETNHIVGVTPILRYSAPLSESVRPYFEFGAGPILMGLRTHEQEKPGFSFYDQVGAGFEFRSGTDHSLLVGYRFHHISHGGLRDTRNRGIEGHTLLVGLSLKLP